MQKNKYTKLKNRKGFTLIELIVVLAILGILAAIAVPNFTAIQEDAKLKADKATSEGIIKAARLQHFADGITEDGILKADTLRSDYFDKTDAKVQSKSTNGTFYLVAIDRDGTVATYSTEYGVLWLTEATKGKIVLENGSDIYEVSAIANIDGLTASTPNDLITIESITINKVKGNVIFKDITKTTAAYLKEIKFQ